MDMPLDPESLRILLEWLAPMKWVVSICMLVLAIGWAVGRARRGGKQ